MPLCKELTSASQDEYHTDSSDEIFTYRSPTWHRRRQMSKERRDQRLRIKKERDEAMLRIEEALRKSEDLLMADLDAENEMNQELKEQMLQLLFTHEDTSLQREDELAGLGQWFRVHSDSAKSYNLAVDSAVDIEQYSMNSVQSIIARMTGLRQRIQDMSSALVTSAQALSKREVYEQRIQDQQGTFHEELAKMAENSNRMEKHTADLLVANGDMKEKLKKLEGERNLWHRRFEEIETKEQSLFMQMEETIAQRTKALNDTMLRQARSADERIEELLKQEMVMREEQHTLKDMLHMQEMELVKYKADVVLGLEKIAQLEEEIKRLRGAAVPAADIMVRLRGELDKQRAKSKTLEGELSLTRRVAVKEGDEWMAKALEYRKLADEKEEMINRMRAVGQANSEEQEEVLFKLHSDVARLTKALSEANGKLSDVTDANDKLSNRVERMKEEIANKDKRAQDAKVRLEESMRLLTDRDAEVQRNAAQIEALQAQLQEKEAQAKALALQIRKLERMLGIASNDDGDTSLEGESDHTDVAITGQMDYERVVVSIEWKRLMEDAIEEHASNMHKLLTQIEGLQKVPTNENLDQGDASDHSRVSEGESVIIQMVPGGVGGPHAVKTSDNARIQRAVKALEALASMSSRSEAHNNNNSSSSSSSSNNKIEVVAASAPSAPAATRRKSIFNEKGEETVVSVCDVASQTDEQTHAKTPPLRSTASSPDLARTPSHEIGLQLRHLVANVWKFREAAMHQVFGADVVSTPGAGGGMDMHVLKAKLEKIRDVNDASALVDDVLGGLLDFMRSQWERSGVKEMAKVLIEAKAQETLLVQEATAAGIESYVQAKRLQTSRKTLEMLRPNMPAPRFLQTMEEREAEQRRKWQQKMQEIKTHRAQHILKCMDAFVKVVDLNFKVHLRPGLLHDVHAIMYTSLTDSPGDTSSPQHSNTTQFAQYKYSDGDGSWRQKDLVAQLHKQDLCLDVKGHHAAYMDAHKPATAMPYTSRSDGGPRDGYGRQHLRGGTSVGAPQFMIGMGGGNVRAKTHVLPLKGSLSARGEGFSYKIAEVGERMLLMQTSQQQQQQQHVMSDGARNVVDTLSLTARGPIAVRPMSHDDTMERKTAQSSSTSPNDKLRIIHSPDKEKEKEHRERDIRTAVPVPKKPGGVPNAAQQSSVNARRRTAEATALTTLPSLPVSPKQPQLTW